MARPFPEDEFDEHRLKRVLNEAERSNKLTEQEARSVFLALQLLLAGESDPFGQDRVYNEARKHGCNIMWDIEDLVENKKRENT